MMRAKYAVSGLTTGLALLAFSAPGLQAQTTLGVRGGVSVASASFSASETFDKSNRTGFVGGLFWDAGGSSLFGFQIGGNYVQKGVTVDDEDLKVDYIEIPAVVKVGVPLGLLKPSVLGGVGVAFNTKCEVDGAALGFDGDCKDQVKGTEWSGILGADVGVYLGSISLWFDARYHFGLNNISKDEVFDDLKNRAWNITGGLGFAVGG